MTAQTEVRITCPHQKCSAWGPVSVGEFFIHLKDVHSVEELRWILTGVEERSDKDTRDSLVRMILRNLFNTALGRLKSLNVYHTAELKGINAPL